MVFRLWYPRPTKTTWPIHHYGIPLIGLVYVLGSLQPRGRQRPGLAIFSCDRQGPKRSPKLAYDLGSHQPRERLRPRLAQAPGSPLPGFVCAPNSPNRPRTRTPKLALEIPSLPTPKLRVCLRPGLVSASLAFTQSG